MLGILSAGMVITSGWAAEGVVTQEIDSAHSSISFSIRHFYTQVKGGFDKVSGEIQFNKEKPEESSVKVRIDVASINTGVDKRDEHLRSADFFEVEKYPEMTFVSTKVEKTGDKTGKIHGDLTLHGVTKPVVLDVEFLGSGPDGKGNVRNGWTGTTTLKRSDFGITYNQVVEELSVIGDDVEVTLDLSTLSTSDS